VSSIEFIVDIDSGDGHELEALVTNSHQFFGDNLS
jgi:hypothetical protein